MTSQGELGVGGANYGTDGQVLTSGGAGAAPTWADASGGSFSGPGSSTDNAVVRFNGTGGATGQNSGVTIDDSNNATGFANLTLSGELDAATGDFSGDVDIDGTLETDALTIGGTALLANDTNNRVTTATGSGTFNGEANLTFDGSTLTVTGDQHIADGNGLIIGHTSGVAPEGVTGEFQMLGTGNADTFASITRFQASADGPAFFLSKSRHGTIGSSAIVQDGDSLGYMAWCGDDGNDLINIGAAIRSNVDGTPGNNNIPGRLTFHTATGGTLSERMRITAAGQTKCTGTGNIVSLTASSGTEASMNFTPASNNAWQLGAGPLTAATFQLYENTAGAARITVKEGGNVGIGTTSPGFPLTVVGNVSGDPYWITRIQNSASSSVNGMQIYFSGADPDNNTDEFFRCQGNGGVVRMRIYSDGDVNTHDAGTLTSDSRLKTNIVDASDKLADVMKLQVRNYEWTPEFHPNKVGEKKIGFIAQELETVFPALVSDHDIATDNSIEEELYDADDDTQYYVDGDELPDGKQLGDVKTESQIPDGKEIGDVKVAAKAHEPTIRKAYKDAFAPILVKALQEVTTRLEAAEAEIAALKSA
jgi:hypothetical protein